MAHYIERTELELAILAHEKAMMNQTSSAPLQMATCLAHEKILALIKTLPTIEINSEELKDSEK